MKLKNNHHDDQRNQTIKWLCTTHIREEKNSRQYAMQGMFQILVKNNLTLIQNFTKTTTLFERLNGSSFYSSLIIYFNNKTTRFFLHLAM